MKGFSEHLFWDTDADTICLNKHQSWLIKRVLEMGTLEDWTQLRKSFPLTSIVDAVKNLRQLEKKAANFACAYYEIDPQELRCLKENQSQVTHWSY